MDNKIDAATLFPIQATQEQKKTEHQLSPGTILENTIVAEQFITMIKGYINNKMPLVDAYAAAVFCIAKLTNNPALITMLNYK